MANVPESVNPVCRSLFFFCKRSENSYCPSRKVHNVHLLAHSLLKHFSNLLGIHSCFFLRIENHSITPHLENELLTWSFATKKAAQWYHQVITFTQIPVVF